MRRREFVAVLGSAAATWALTAHAQQLARPLFGILLGTSQEGGKTFTEPIRAYLQALGYAEGKNIAFDFRFADGKVDRLPALATELVMQRPAVIATFGDASAHAAQAATASIPIVAMSEDLVRAKLVASLQRPGGNTTGVSILGTELDAKRLELLAQMLPPRSTVLLLADPTTHRESRPVVNSTAQALGVTLREDIVGTPEEIERALRGAKESGIAAVNVLASALLFSLRGRIINLAAELGLPAMYQWPETTEAGGLIAYGPSLRGAFRQVVTLVVKVLQGAKPSDLPVEQPTRFIVALNLKTAKALGVTIPQSLLLRADEVIQ